MHLQLGIAKEGVEGLNNLDISGIGGLRGPGQVQGVFFNWSYPENYKFFSVSKMLRTFKLVPP